MPRKRTWDVWNGGRLVTDLDTCAQVAGLSRVETARDLIARRNRVDVPVELLAECERVLSAD